MLDFINCKRSDLPFFFFCLLWAVCNFLGSWAKISWYGPIRQSLFFGASLVMGGLCALAIGWMLSKLTSKLSAAGTANWVLLLGSAAALALATANGPTLP